ncbi:hypothetical protein GGF46_005018 [Coemansia sp. RSA 552]|nr:hypothetical protein GGF46_005018 [Coemansia sp. RSA 552]
MTLEVAAHRSDAEALTNHCYEQGDLVSKWGCIVEPFGCDYPDIDVTDSAKATRHGYTDLRDQIGLSPELSICTLDRYGACAYQLLPPSSNEPVCLLNEQYIVKPPRSGAEFAWHQDVLYFTASQRQTCIVSVWTPLDDVDAGNGTVLIDPYPDPKAPGHYPDGSRDPVVANMRAGSALFMDGRLRHCSGGNSSGSFRTAFMPQFSQMPMRDERGGYIALAVPVGKVPPVIDRNKELIKKT